MFGLKAIQFDHRSDGADTVVTVLTASATSTRVAIPTASDGQRARVVCISNQGTAGVGIRPGDSTVTTDDTNEQLIVMRDGPPAIINVAGHTHVAFNNYSSSNSLVVMSAVANQ